MERLQAVVVASILFFQLGGANTVNLPLYTRSVGNGGGIDVVREIAHVRRRYGQNTPHTGKRAVESIPIVNQNYDQSYYTPVTFGTPPQSFDLLLDTGSDTLWVTDSTCRTCDATQLFNSSASSTFSRTGLGTTNKVIEYGSGDAEGRVVTDEVSMGPFKVSRQDFVAVNRLSSGVLQLGLPGVLGLSLANPRTDIPIRPFWLNLANSGQLTESTLSFFMARATSRTDGKILHSGGVFTLGGINNTLYDGDIEYHPVVRNPSGQVGPWWTIDVTSLTVNGQTLNITRKIAAIDSGTNIIAGPSDEIKLLWDAIPGSAPSETLPGAYTFPCSTKISASISFGERLWDIDPADMILGTIASGSDKCYGAILNSAQSFPLPAGGASPDWVIGSTFLKNVYSVYRLEPLSVGFAQLSNFATSGDALTPPPSIGPTKSSPQSGASLLLPLKPFIALATLICTAGILYHV